MNTTLKHIGEVVLTAAIVLGIYAIMVMFALILAPE